MTWKLDRLRRFALLMLAVMLLGALAPTLSRAQAWAQDRSASWIEVCTTEGMQSVRASLTLTEATTDAPLEGRTSDPLTLDHCGWCILSGERLVPPTQHAPWQVVPPTPLRLALAPTAQPPTASPWTVQSRGPPSPV
jgi:hypothetical protein